MRQSVETLVNRTGTSIEPLPPEVLAAVDDLELAARIVVDGLLAGRHRSMRRGLGGAAFAQYRAYVQGDDLRHVDWKQFARSERLNVKLHEEETDMRLAIVLDATASMAYRGSRAVWSKYRFACMLAACLAHLAGRQGDRLGLFLYGRDGLSSCVASSSQGFMASMTAAMSKRQPQGHGSLTSALDAATDFLGHRGCLVLLSDLHDYEERLPELLKMLHQGRRDALVIHVLDDDELDLPFGDGIRFIDSETQEEIVASAAVIRSDYSQAMSRFVDNVREICLSSQTDRLLGLTSRAPGALLAEFLRHREGRRSC